jgi:hypothetical protein
MIMQHRLSECIADFLLSQKVIKNKKKKYIYGTQLVISSIINLYIIAYQIGQGTEFTGYRIETKQRYREQGGKSSLLYKMFNRQK